MKVYYAHCMALYGTQQEKRDIALLKDLGFTVVNPNTKEHREDSEGQMGYFITLACAQDAVAFRALPDGRIPAGVAKEVNAARNSNKPIIELPSGISWRMMDVDETVEYLKEVGQR